MSQPESDLIGGEFELHPEDLTVDPDDQRALPGFGSPHEIWLDTGRAALAVAARDTLLRGGRPKVWLPAYCCESILAPFARKGFSISYYRVGADLAGVEFDGIEGDTFLFVHYFGWRNRGAIDRIHSLRARGIKVVEDCVQAGLTGAIGTHGDYAVSSLRKLLPQPDGALLASNLPVTSDAAASDEETINARVLGKLLRGARVADDVYLRLFEHAEQRIGRSEPREMSWLSRALLRAADLAEASTRRRANWACLRDALRDTGKLHGLSSVFDTLEQGEVPLGLPLRVPGAQRDALRRHLSGQRIHCPVHWPLDHLPAHGFAEERALSASILTLPLDQRYRTHHMERIIDALQSFPGDLQ